MLGLTGNETPLDKATSWDSSQPFDAYSVKDTNQLEMATILTPFSIPYLYSADFVLTIKDGCPLLTILLRSNFHLHVLQQPRNYVSNFACIVV